MYAETPHCMSAEARVFSGDGIGTSAMKSLEDWSEVGDGVRAWLRPFLGLAFSFPIAQSLFLYIDSILRPFPPASPPPTPQEEL